MTSLLARARANPGTAALLAVVGAVLLAVVLWLTQPWLLLVDAEVDEPFPVAAVDAAGAGAAATGATGTPSPGVASPPSDAPSATPIEPSADVATTGPEAPAPTPRPTASASPTPRAGPEPLLAGEFVSRDHGTTGTATVHRLEDGSLTLRIEDLATDNGPDLFVYLDDDAADAPEDAFDDGRSLGRLKGNRGNQNYPVPDDVALDGVASVVIWCDRFSSAFGAADLRPVG